MTNHEKTYCYSSKRSVFLCILHKLVVVSSPLLSWILASALIVLALCASPLAAAPSAGTIIENQASATYFNPTLNRSETLQSNPVRAILDVQQVVSLSLVTNQQVLRSPGAPVTFDHRLTNTGNTPLSVYLTATNVAGSSFTLAGCAIVQDLNHNGIADSDEPIVAQGEKVDLAPGASMNLVIRGMVPGSAIQGQSSTVTLTADSTFLLDNKQSVTVSATVTDLVTINTAALLLVNKQASNYKPNQGEQVTFSLTAVNNGNGVAQGGAPTGGKPLLVNGIQNQLVLIRDVIPNGTSYVPGSLATKQTAGILLYHKTDDPGFSYLTSEPASVDEVAYGVSALPAGQTVAFSFRVKITSKATGNVSNIGYALYIDRSGGQTLDTPSNTATLSIVPVSGLFLEKSASRTTAEIADFIDYTIKVTNSGGKILNNVALNDTLPLGFSYQKGTSRRDGAIIADPGGGSGPKLVFHLGELAVGAVVQITYRLKIGPGALRGDGINRAQAKDDSDTVSNLASAVVTLTPGVFTDKGIIIGKFFLDCDRNRIQGAKELGVPGVRIYLEDGTYAITDSEGKYSFYGISPRTHVLKVDETTLPPGSELIALTNRHAGDAVSAFVDLKTGELQRTDFAEGSCTAEMLTLVRLRRLKGEVFVAETTRSVDTKLTLDQPILQASDVKSRPASGLVGNDIKLPYFSSVMSPDEQQRGRTNLPDQPVAAAQLQDYAGRLAGMDSKPGFIDLRDGDILPIAQSTIRVKGSSVSDLKLLVNGEQIDESRVGKKVIVADQKLEAREYIGIPFKPGKNRLELIQTDSFGNPRGSANISVTAPDALARIQIQAPQGDQSADGQTPLIIKIRLTDENGVPVTTRTPLTLESSLGRWNEKDLSEQEQGLQVFLEGGQAEYRLIAPADPGIATLRASSGNIKSQQTISFIPNLRPLIAFGVIEGTLNLHRMDLGSISPAHSQDGFEQELTTISTGDDKHFSAASRAAFFLKGKIKGDYLLTMSYDSDKDTREKLFRDISPDEFYPIYGDSSIRGFDAQSTGRFYVRVDKNRSYLLYGDFTTQAGNNEVRVLGAYNRSLTGLRTHYENSFLSSSAFLSQDKSRQVIDEIPALGVSGPYFLKNAEIVENSEKIEIITRDRNQPSLLIKSVPMSRFSDYEIEALTGRILFKEPVNSRDSNLNLVYIRATYEVSQNGPDYLVYGGDLQLKLHNRLEIGGNYVRDQNPLDQQELGSVNATIKLAEKTFLLAEWAHMSRQLTELSGSSGQGDGARVELRHESENLNARIYGYQTDTGFDNPSSSITKGRTELGAKLRYTLSKKTVLSTEAIFSEDQATNGNLKGVIVNLEQAITSFLKGELGVRYAKESVTASQTIASPTLTPTENTTVRVKLGMQIPFYSKLGLFAEYEQSVNSINSRSVAVGSDYQIAPQTRLYVRHELISSLVGQFSLNDSQQRNTTLMGVESEYMKDGHLFSEYRMRDSVSGRDAEAAVGLRNGWQLTPGIRLNTNAERITTLGGSTSNDATALGLGLEYTGSTLWKGSTRLEFRTSHESDSYLGTIGLAYKYSRSITLLGREVISYTSNKGIGLGSKIDQRTQIGLAYRPVDSNRFNLLSKYEFRYESDDTNPATTSLRMVHILSAGFNLQASRALIFSGRYAGKLVEDDSGSIFSHSTAHMVTGHLTYDLSKKWDVGLNAMSLFNNSLNSMLYGLGGELGYLLTANLWLSAGYNFFGFYDRDLSGENYTNPGGFMRMRFKFDEHLLDGLQHKTLNDGPQQ